MADKLDEGAAEIVENAGGPKVKAAKEKEAPPVFKYMESTKVPVSSKRGKLWHGRLQHALRIREEKNLNEAWKTARAYYNNNQLNHRFSATNDPSKHEPKSVADLYKAHYRETENIIYADINAQMALLYAKNPTIEATPYDVNDQQADSDATITERVLHAIADAQFMPGVNLEPKVHRITLITALTNRAYIELEGISKLDSSDEAIKNLTDIATKLQKAKTQEEIVALEGELLALEEKVSFLSPPGVKVKVKQPEEVVTDPDVPDWDQKKWIMVREDWLTSRLNAEFGITKLDAQGKRTVKSVYMPSKILPSGEKVDLNGDTAPLNDYTGNEHEKFGFTDAESFDRSKVTRCWRVWDKVTRRVELYADNDWKFPIWVWDDPYNLPGFFPLVPFESYINPDGNEAIGEVMYQLDQQDAINDNNAMKKKWRMRSDQLMYNSRVVKDRNEVNKYVNNETAIVGFDLDPEADLRKLFLSKEPPNIRLAELFDNSPHYQAAGRVSGINEALRAGQFKTNTTNDAIAEYTAATQGRMDYKRAGLENAMGQVYQMLYHMAVKYISPESILPLVGPQLSQQWADVVKRAAAQPGYLSFRVVAGSTQRPNSDVKRQEAIQIGQVIGQFAEAAPAAIITILKVFERAFDSFTITKEDWKAIQDSIQQMLVNRQGGQPGAEGTAGAEGNPEAIVEQVTGFLENLPPNVVQAAGQALASGEPARDVVGKLWSAVNESQNSPAG